ncbi:putative acyltransferase [Sulfitobacter noctilucae]|uniref:LpxL/LpxP family acyltransferase n=1 Tax=Sulfitobacter noctilucae TaxID=1342302 RepID=UPI000467F65B|nr:hypothetical protein [Sulfitobacter noctilucae]KIN61487.1 putative acyltransferase [Sulfitobacter noctilucae]
MSFKDTKDRIWVYYDAGASWLARRSRPVRKLGYGVFGVVLWIAYLVPGSKVRATFAALRRHVGWASSLRLFHRYVRGFLRGFDRIEQVRHGRTDAIDAMLRIPDQERLDAMLSQGGVLLLVPHAHATLAMGRGLSRHYPYLALVRSTADKRRAASELGLYRNLGCKFLDIQLENPTVVARQVLTALKKGQLVVAIADRLRTTPPADDPVDISNDVVRVTSFGAPVGIASWPARFAEKAGVPIVAATVVQSSSTITLEMGPAVDATPDLLGTTQAWVDALEQLNIAHPDEWTFALDRHWSKALRGTDQGT